MNAADERTARALKWRGWSIDGTSLGVCEAVNRGEAEKKFQKVFGAKLELVTGTFRGAEVTVTVAA